MCWAISALRWSGSADVCWVRMCERTGVAGAGEIATVKMDEADQATIELGAYRAICCSQPLTAKVSADGQSLSGTWLSGINRTVRPPNWVKVAGNSCIPARELATY